LGQTEVDRMKSSSANLTDEKQEAYVPIYNKSYCNFIRNLPTSMHFSNKSCLQSPHVYHFSRMGNVYCHIANTYQFDKSRQVLQFAFVDSGKCFRYPSIAYVY